MLSLEGSMKLDVDDLTLAQAIRQLTAFLHSIVPSDSCKRNALSMGGLKPTAEILG